MKCSTAQHSTAKSVAALTAAALVITQITACGTLTGIPAHGGGKRFATEQRLVSASIRSSLKDMDVSALRGKRTAVVFDLIADEGGGSFSGGRINLAALLSVGNVVGPTTTTSNVFQVFDLNEKGSNYSNTTGSSGGGSVSTTISTGTNSNTSTTNGTGTNNALSTGTSTNTGITNGTSTNTGTTSGTSTNTGTTTGSNTNTSTTNGTSSNTNNNGGTSTTNTTTGGVGSTQTTTSTGTSTDNGTNNSTTNGSGTNTSTTNGSGTNTSTSSGSGTNTSTSSGTGTNASSTSGSGTNANNTNGTSTNASTGNGTGVNNGTSVTVTENYGSSSSSTHGSFNNSRQALSPTPVSSTTKTEGTRKERTASLSTNGLGDYQNFNVPKSDASLLMGLVRNYLILNGVIPTVPTDKDAEALLYVTVDIFGIVRSRFDTYLYNNEKVKAETAFEMMAFDRNGKMIMAPKSANREASYGEHYLLWAGPVTTREQVFKGQGLLVDFSDVDGSKAKEPLIKSCF